MNNDETRLQLLTNINETLNKQNIYTCLLHVSVHTAR